MKTLNKKFFKSFKNIKKDLLQGNVKIAVWGVGYIGLSSMVYFAKKGVNCIGYDISEEKIQLINRGILPIPDLKKWFNFNIKSLVKRNKIFCTNNFSDLINSKTLVHLIAIPTEKNGKPYFSILFDILKKISNFKKYKIKPIIIIESTLTPAFTKKFILPFCKNIKFEENEDFLLGVAPRRDWFVANTKNLEHLDRVVGSNNHENGLIIKDILSIVCKNIHIASTYSISEMVKSVENAYRHMEITLANQLSIAYKNFNIREVLQLVGTKWNIGTFYPGFGTGGYCIPLSSQYVLREVKKKKHLTLLRETIKTDNQINKIIAKSLVKRKSNKIAILGLSYKGNLKVSTLSPVIPFIKELKKHNVDVKIFDPFYSSQEISDITGLKSFSYPDDLDQFDTIVISIDHALFGRKKKIIENKIFGTQYILDNLGIWKKFKKNKNTIYKISGEENWI